MNSNLVLLALYKLIHLGIKIWIEAGKIQLLVPNTIIL